MEVNKRGWDRICLKVVSVQRADFQAHTFFVSAKCPSKTFIVPLFTKSLKILLNKQTKITKKQSSCAQDEHTFSSCLSV